MRTKPYTTVGVRRVTCVHCGVRKARFQWSVMVCANDRRRIHVAVCAECDIEFNRQTLDFIHMPGREELMRDYTAWARQQ